MKKLFSILFAAVMCFAFLCGCGEKQTGGYSYLLDSYSASVWGGSALEDVTVEKDSCSLVFDTDKKEIEFSCNGQTFTGVLGNQSSQSGADLWKVEWDNAPEGSDDYAFSYSAFTCSSDYSKASPFVQLVFYFDGAEDSLEIKFSMKNAE
ncbi:MAG: hypothetical protein E7484_02205 [Ruminococcaceae bacterium]|nr:hypothetical protein [Oscillospiraceae bacterium]